MEDKTVEMALRCAEHNRKIEEFHGEFLDSVDKIQDVECARALLALASFTETCLIRDSELSQAVLDTLNKRQSHFENYVKQALDNIHRGES